MHLNQWELALKDSDVCIKLAPDFVKAHFRRGKALLGLAQYANAVDAFTTALKLKKDNKEIREVLQQANGR
jgi:tetratricopeptide (TPR) repeat protein